MNIVNNFCKNANVAGVRAAMRKFLINIINCCSDNIFTKECSAGLIGEHLRVFSIFDNAGMTRTKLNFAGVFKSL